MTHLVDDLLDVARITRGKIELDPQRLDLNEIIKRATETVAPLIKTKAHTLAVNIHPEPLWVEGDAVRLAQVVSNLLHNAAKYTKEQGDLQLNVGVDEAGATISVRDNGVGIAAELLPRVFDLFTQAEGERAMVRGGLGVGLSLVRTLVEMHGGQVQARSDGAGRGSEFVVQLPLAAPLAAPDADDPHAPAEGAAAVRRILVVDDSRDVADSFAKLLEILGHCVETAEDGPSALALARSFAPEVIFLDIGLPGMDGYEVARRLRAQEGAHPPRIIALTGYGRRPGAAADEQRLFDHFLLKPGDLATVETILASISDVDTADPSSEED